MIQVDERVQAAFDDALARTRKQNAQVTADLAATAKRLEQEAGEREARAEAERAQLREKADRLLAVPQKPQPRSVDRGAGELAFGLEDEEGEARPSQPAQQPHAQPQAQPQPRGGQQEPPTQPFTQQPPSWQQPAQQPPARGRRAAPPPDDDDMSGQTWLS
ncbi:hypothetical protein KCV87_23190 [Actinosynnema pretiosum subsp. pretiosum]|uniref:Uncharacterized protein n=2 Tax=Actinosynnema TaxID=40566 RepID=C6WLX4_ACTMD|nr:hypothetical protein [Actinosynnema mirum]ACU40359.1 conserved hypothetical protein [Actinosynnema mirum DSM 43827]AXX33871.1 hypothetical protein APASM_6506 [Actinosynnema pretiosum subsp. pretiosum]QUF02372.1 hypothetical protein KCV87_23190 [Actinosynnema pretiosum subsp. pretiosum]